METPLRRKSNGRFALLRLLLIAVTAFSVACGEEFSTDSPTGHEVATTTTLATLQALQTDRVVTIDEELVVAGRVTTSDAKGNFYRSLLIEEGGSALEVMVALDGLHNDYPIGAKLYVRLQGLSLGRRLGVLQAGLPADPASGFEIDYIPSKAAAQKHLTRSAAPLAELLPKSLTLGKLSPKLCGLRIRLEALHHVPESTDESPFLAGYHRYEDAEGHAIYLYVRDYADFAQQPLPATISSVTGILQYDARGEGRYLIKPNDAHDICP